MPPIPAAVTAWPTVGAFAAMPLSIFPAVAPRPASPAAAVAPFAAIPMPFSPNTASAKLLIAPIVSAAPSMPSYIPRFSKMSGVRKSTISP